MCITNTALVLFGKGMYYMWCGSVVMGQPPQNKHQWPYSPFHNTTKSSHNNDSSNTQKKKKVLRRRACWAGSFLVWGSVCLNTSSIPISSIVFFLRLHTFVGILCKLQFWWGRLLHPTCCYTNMRAWHHHYASQHLYGFVWTIYLTHLDLKTPINSHIAAYDQAHDTPDSACKVDVLIACCFYT